MKWQSLKSPDELLGTLVLLREEYTNTSNVKHFVGIITEDSDGYAIVDYGGKHTRLEEEYFYYFIKVNQILF